MYYHQPPPPLTSSSSLQLLVLERALRLICDSFDRVVELLRLIVDLSLRNVTSGAAEESYLLNLLPLKDGMAASQQHIQEVAGGRREEEWWW